MHMLGGPVGLQHSEASVRQISIDLLGLIAANLHRESMSAEDDQQWLAQMASLDGTATMLYMRWVANIAWLLVST